MRQNVYEPLPIPCTVLDPFGGSGTVAVVAKQLCRRFVHVDINPEYIEMAKRRVAEPYAKPLPVDTPGQLMLAGEDGDAD